MAKLFQSFLDSFFGQLGYFSHLELQNMPREISAISLAFDDVAKDFPVKEFSSTC